MFKRKSLIQALLALVILFGLLFLQAGSYFLALPWTNTATIMLYMTTTTCTLSYFLNKREYSPRLNKIDVCFTAFVCSVAASLGVTSPYNAIALKMWAFLLVMVVVPYIAGRSIVRSATLHRLRELILIAGLAIIPMLVLDRLLVDPANNERFTYFGMNHSPLMAGGLLTASLIAIQSWILSLEVSNTKKHSKAKLVGYSLLAVISLFLVWVSARGWLLAGLLGSLCITTTAKEVTILKRVLILLFVFIVVLISMAILKYIDPVFGGVYVRAEAYIPYSQLTRGLFSGHFSGIDIVDWQSGCEATKIGVDSIAIRLMLLREAFTAFQQNPVFGVGAASFGLYSCVGLGGFPHSTAVQAFAELGSLGGGLLTVLIVFTGVNLFSMTTNSERRSSHYIPHFFFAYFVGLIFADQIYGNYFMSAPVYMLIGIAASMNGVQRLGVDGRA